MVTLTRAQGKQSKIVCEVCKSIVGQQHNLFFFIFINLLKRLRCSIYFETKHNAGNQHDKMKNPATVWTQRAAENRIQKKTAFSMSTTCSIFFSWSRKNGVFIHAIEKPLVPHPHLPRWDFPSPNRLRKSCRIRRIRRHLTGNFLSQKP